MNKATPQIVAYYTAVIEDLLYVGSQLFAFGNFMAEERMIKNTFYIDIDADNHLSVTRPPENEAILSKIAQICEEDFPPGIMDDNAIPDMKNALQHGMGINYDFAGG